ncbi:MAG: toxin-antitoxin system, toxin component, PIN family protein [Gemmatimonas sp.]|nr:toxin-antitoxin system, toxin component, PIN family protein [Gemmatimonas sp.]
MIQFLIDECLTPKLVEVANRFGYVAYHVVHRGWTGKEDPEILAYMREESLTLVTNNWRDFGPMLRREEIHPGAIVIPDLPRAEQIVAFERALRAIEASDPPADMVNTVIELMEPGEVRVFQIP